MNTVFVDVDNEHRDILGEVIASVLKHLPKKAPAVILTFRKSGCIPELKSWCAVRRITFLLIDPTFPSRSRKKKVKKVAQAPTQADNSRPQPVKKKKAPGLTRNALIFGLHPTRLILSGTGRRNKKLLSAARKRNVIVTEVFGRMVE